MPVASEQRGCLVGVGLPLGLLYIFLGVVCGEFATNFLGLECNGNCDDNFARLFLTGEPSFIAHTSRP